MGAGNGVYMYDVFSTGDSFWSWTVCPYSEITRKSCIVFMARFDGVHAFGYNSAGSEAIWMKIVAHS